MIELHIKSTPEQRENQEEFSNKLHKALRGWQAYIDSDVLLNVDDEDETIFLIGPAIPDKTGRVYRVQININLDDIEYTDRYDIKRAENGEV